MGCLFTGYANSTEKLYDDCSSCSTTNDYQSVAAQYVSQGKTRHVYVSNIVKSEVRKFVVKSVSTSTPGFADEPGMPLFITQIYQTGLSSASVDSFNRMASVFNENAFNTYIDVALPSDIAVSIYDLIDNTRALNNTVDFALSPDRLYSNELELYNSYLQDFVYDFVGARPRKQFLRVIFPDGSKAYFEVVMDEDGAIRNIDLKYIDGRDVNNNSIKLEREEVTKKSYYFTGSNSLDFFAASLRAKGYSMIFEEGPQLSCVPLPGGGGFKCSLPKEGDEDDN